MTSTQLLTCQANISPPLIRVRIKRSKTDQFGWRAYIFLAQTQFLPSSHICQFNLLSLLLYISGWFLSLQSQTGTSRALVSVGIDQTFCKGHSFRIGVATTTAALDDLSKVCHILAQAPPSWQGSILEQSLVYVCVIVYLWYDPTSFNQCCWGEIFNFGRSFVLFG